LWEAIDWYDDQKENLGKSFARAVENTVNTIRINPLQYAQVLRGKRKAPVKNFPYIVVFKVDRDCIVVLAIFHTSRNPELWKSR
jgi:toxin ParE1/3/4